MISIEERLWSRVDKNGPVPTHRPELGPCWNWTGAIQSNGYGKIGLNGKTPYSHRVAFELSNGPVPDGLELDHLCRNHSCARPSHLEAVTHAENIRRGEQAMRTHCPAGHEYDTQNTRMNNGKRICMACHRARERRRREVNDAMRV